MTSSKAMYICIISGTKEIIGIFHARNQECKEIFINRLEKLKQSQKKQGIKISYQLIRTKETAINIFSKYTGIKKENVEIYEFSDNYFPTKPHKPVLRYAVLLGTEDNKDGIYEYLKDSHEKNNLVKNFKAKEYMMFGEILKAIFWYKKRVVEESLKSEPLYELSPEPNIYKHNDWAIIYSWAEILGL